MCATRAQRFLRFGPSSSRCQGCPHCLPPVGPLLGHTPNPLNNPGGASRLNASSKTPRKLGACVIPEQATAGRQTGEHLVWLSLSPVTICVSEARSPGLTHRGWKGEGVSPHCSRSAQHRGPRAGRAEAWSRPAVAAATGRFLSNLTSKATGSR